MVSCAGLALGHVLGQMLGRGARDAWSRPESPRKKSTRDGVDDGRVV
jgi:hypothetical protein